VNDIFFWCAQMPGFRLHVSGSGLGVEGSGLRVPAFRLRLRFWCAQMLAWVAVVILYSRFVFPCNSRAYSTVNNIGRRKANLE